MPDPRSDRAREEAEAALSDLLGAPAGSTLEQLRALVAPEVEAARRLASTAAARAQRRRELARGMAEVMVRMADLRGGCTRDDLRRHFTDAEIDRLHADALRLARALSPAHAELAEAA